MTAKEFFLSRCDDERVAQTLEKQITTANKVKEKGYSMPEWMTGIGEHFDQIDSLVECTPYAIVQLLEDYKEHLLTSSTKQKFEETVWKKF